MKGFIEVKKIIGDKVYTNLINVNSIIYFEGNYIRTKDKGIHVQENREEIEKLIKQATEL